MKYKRTIIWIAILTIGCAVVLLPKNEHSRKSSPDGKLVAIAYSRVIWSMIPVFPGGGSDKPGWIRIETKDGKKIKEYSVEMLSFIEEIKWEGNTARLSLREPE